MFIYEHLHFEHLKKITIHINDLKLVTAIGKRKECVKETTTQK